MKTIKVKINNIQELWTFCIANKIDIGTSIYDVLVEEKRLKEELEVYKKALKLSIKKGVGLMGYGTVEIDRRAEIKWKEHFIEKARKGLENES